MIRHTPKSSLHAKILLALILIAVMFIAAYLRWKFDVWYISKAVEASKVTP